MRVALVLVHTNGSFVQGVSVQVTVGADVQGPAAMSVGVCMRGVMQGDGMQGAPCRHEQVLQ